MACRSCQSENQEKFSSEINIHFPRLNGLNKPTVATYPELVAGLFVTLFATDSPSKACGLASFVRPQSQAWPHVNFIPGKHVDYYPIEYSGHKLSDVPQPCQEYSCSIFPRS